MGHSGCIVDYYWHLPWITSDNVRFKRPVVPGDKLILKSEVKTVKRNIWRFPTQALVDDKIVCKAELLCAYTDKDEIK